VCSTSGVFFIAASMLLSRSLLSAMLASGAVLKTIWNSPLSCSVMKEDSSVPKIMMPTTKEAKASPSTLFL